MTQVGPIPVLPDIIEGNARVKVLNNGTLVGTRRTIDLIPGTNVTLTIVDSPANEKVSVTINGSSGSPSGAAGGSLAGTYPNPTIASGAITTTEIANGTIAQADLASGYRMSFAGTSAPGSPTEGDLWFDTTNNLLNVYNGTVWYTTTPVSATVATGETRSSATFGALTTAGPAVSVLTGTSAIVIVGASLSTGIANASASMGYVISGATTLAAASTRAVRSSLDDVTVAGGLRDMSKLIYQTGLTAGTNTFTSQYAGNGSATVTFTNRYITVIGLP